MRSDWLWENLVLLKVALSLSACRHGGLGAPDAGHGHLRGAESSIPADASAHAT